MGIKIKKYKDSYRPNWYAVFQEEGRERSVNLGVEIAGTPPEDLSLRKTGDIAFERSRARAQKAYEDMMTELRQKGNTEHLIKRLIDSKTGTDSHLHRLDELAGLWNGICRTKELCEDRVKNNRHAFAEFHKLCGKEYLYQVTVDDVTRYINALRKEKAWGTINSRISLLSGAFTRFLPEGCQNPFSGVLKRRSTDEDATIHKTPLSSEQIEAVRAHVRRDAFLHPLFECALNTGMRLKDICFLPWSAVDLRNGFLCYRASKTGARCHVPIFPEFRKVLDGLIATKDPDETLVFPEAAAMYRDNRTGIVRRGKLLFCDALYPRQSTPVEDITYTDSSEGNAQTPTMEEAFSSIDRQGFIPSKANRMKEVFRRYTILGQSYRTIASETGIPKSLIGGYMTELQDIMGRRIIRFDKNHVSTRKRLMNTRQRRAEGKRCVSTLGWHSLRTTFCCLAILHGVPSSEIIKAVGHTTFNTTQEYYSGASQELVREAWLKNMAGTAIVPTSTSVQGQDIHRFVHNLTPETRTQLLLELGQDILT